jgi:hypothetical protein
MSEDTLHAKGFILHKMYHYGYVCKKKGHGKHTAVESLNKGCPTILSYCLPQAIAELKAERLLIVWPTGYGPQACVIANAKGYGYANDYQKFANLPVIDYTKPPPANVPPLPLDELHKLKMKKTR